MNTLRQITFWAAFSALVILTYQLEAAPVSTATRGHVLLLDNERIIEGDIEQQEGQYRIRRSVGETWVPAEHAVFLAANLEEAYGYLRACANLRDIDERLRLARWCSLHGLKKQAVEEAAAAVELKPDNVECKRLLRAMQRTALKPASPPLPKKETTVVASEQPMPEMTVESTAAFTTHIQPILMNTCVSCHASNRGGDFKLVRAMEDGVVNRRATQQNLAAVLAKLNREHCQQSVFLTKAVTVHGDSSQPPIKNRETAAYRALEEWVRTALTNNPQLQTNSTENLPVVELAPNQKNPEVPIASVPGKIGTTVSISRPAAPAVDSTQSQAALTSSSTAPLDPYDPVIFNRQMHPDR